MWQADTFDSKTIDRELAWAASLGERIQAADRAVPDYR